MRKETVDIGIHVTFRNADRKIIIYQNNEQTSLDKKEVELVEPVQINIYQSKTYRKDLSWLHFDDESSGQESEAAKERLAVLHIHFCSFYLINLTRLVNMA